MALVRGANRSEPMVPDWDRRRSLGSLLGTWWGLTIFKQLSGRRLVISLNLLLILSGITLAL